MFFFFICKIIEDKHILSFLHFHYNIQSNEMVVSFISNIRANFSKGATVTKFLHSRRKTVTL